MFPTDALVLVRAFLERSYRIQVRLCLIEVACQQLGPTIHPEVASHPAACQQLGPTIHPEVASQPTAPESGLIR